MSARRYGLSTTAIHGIPRRRPDWAPVAPPVQQSSTFVSPVGSDADILYSRYGNNPNQLELARKYALLEGADGLRGVGDGGKLRLFAHAGLRVRSTARSAMSRRNWRPSKAISSAAA